MDGMPGTAVEWDARVPIANKACRTATWIRASKSRSSLDADVVCNGWREDGGPGYLTFGETVSTAALFLDEIVTETLGANSVSLSGSVCVCAAFARVSCG